MSTVQDRFSDASDAVLTLAIARYDQDALAEAYRRHAGAVFGLARRLVDTTGAEEVAQEIFLRLWDDPTRFDSSRGSLRSYLLTQTHSRAVDIVRADVARRARERRDESRTANAAYDVEHEVWDLARSEQIRASLAALPVDERQAIELAYFGGYTYRQVADRLDEPEGTIKTRIRRGLQRLRSELATAGISMGGT